MKIGAVFPQSEIGAAPAGVRRYAQRVEELGFAHVLAYDHVLGADPRIHSGWQGPYDLATTFHEPFVRTIATRFLFPGHASCHQSSEREIMTPVTTDRG